MLLLDSAQTTWLLFPCVSFSSLFSLLSSAHRYHPLGSISSQFDYMTSTRNTPSRKHRWGEVLSELAVQQNLLHALLVSESSRSNSASRSCSPRGFAGGSPQRLQDSRYRSRTSAPRRCLISPSPDPSRMLQQGDGEEEPDLRQKDTTCIQTHDEAKAVPAATPTRGVDGRAATASERGASQCEAITHLIEALSTSSWSSEGSAHDSGEEKGMGENATRAAGRCEHDSATGLRHLFFARAMRLIDCEYDARQALVLDEMMKFTEISSVYLLATFTASTPQHL